MVKLVGILNITPDSFSDGGKFIDPKAAIGHAEQMFNDGASLVDVGAESTRPNAKVLSTEEEWERLEPVLRALVKKFPNKISLDSYHTETIYKAFGIGPVVVNDVTSFNDPQMVEAVVKLKATAIISHLPKMSIADAHRLQPVSTIAEVKTDLLAKAQILQSKGLDKEQIILDPGIGFGKTTGLNKELLKFAEFMPDYKVMIGYSRKRFLGGNRMDLKTNLEAAKVAIAHGAAYLRVHDVAGHRSLL